MSFDLLTTIEYGGCSAKLDPTKLSEILADLPKIMHPNLMVGIDTHDDAGVYKLNDETALIFTTDFFPPVFTAKVDSAFCRRNFGLSGHCGTSFPCASVFA